MYIIKTIAGLFLVMCIFSCKKETQEFTDSPIIEAYLETGKVLSVKISRQIPFSSGVTYSADDINNLIVHVTCNNVAHALKPIGNGVYTDSTVTVTDNSFFNLAFNFNKKDVSAFTAVPAKPQNVLQSATTYTITKFVAGTHPTGGTGFTVPDPLTVTWSNPDNSYYLTIVENIETVLNPIRDFGTGTAPSNRFKKTPSTSAGVEIRSQEFQYYGMHRIIIYHVLPDYATLYTATNTSSQNLANPSTTILNGYGIFTGLSSDTIFVNVKEP